MNQKTKRLVESAILIAIGTVLSMLTFVGPWPLGGGITVCSMLPLVLVAYRYGTRWGVFTALVYSLLQMLLGISNVQYAPDVLTALGIILLDYVVAFSVVGFAACFRNVGKNPLVGIVTGIVVTFLGRFVCHFLSGWIIWEALWPNELGWAPWVWSLAYNASYMLPEILITAAAAAMSFRPMKKFWLGQA